MARKLQIRRGNNANIPTLSPGEFGLATDTAKLYVGGESGNLEVAMKDDIDGLTATDVGAVPTSRTVNGKALSSDISLAATDVGAVPTSRTINGQALSADITLTAANVGAAGSTHSHAATDITSGTLSSDRLPTVPLAKGGTGATTAPRALYELIRSSSSLISSTVATDDYFALQDTSAGTGKKMSLANLTTYLRNNLGGAQIATGSYAGTGTYGSSNPNSLTFSFTPKFFMVQIDKESDIQMMFLLSTTSGIYFSGRDNSTELSLYHTITSFSTTVSWYATNAHNQFNKSGTTYRYVAIG